MSGRWPGPAARCGAWVKLPAPESIELLALAGLDFAVIDNEHATIDVRTVSTMIATATACGIEPFVRVPGHAPRDVQAPLDAGARGLFVPQVDDVADARAAVGATRFPPLGHRGASTAGRAGRWGLDTVAEYVAKGDDVALVVQVESERALRSVTAVAGVPGVDAVFVGPTDLAVSSGRTGLDEELAALVGEAERACAAAGVPLGTAATSDAAELLGRGYGFLLLGADTGFLRSGARSALDGARQGAASTGGARG